MSATPSILTGQLDIWTSAATEKKSGRGRSSGNGISVYGIQKLRELILELAVRGQLVPQNPNDEPASKLLKRIQAEKAKLIAEGKIKKDKPLSPITDEEKPFELPQGWEWARIGQIGHDWGQKIPDSNFTYIEVSAIDSQRGIISSPELVKPENAPSRARKVVKKGTVIYSTIRPYLLNIAIIEKDFLPEPIASTAFAIVHPFCSMPPRYFLCFFRSPVFVRYVESVQMGIAYPAINDGQFFSGLIPLPPLDEQHRIVAKVDELMVLCDQLETQYNNVAEAHEQLVNHLLGTLTQSHSADEFGANWQRIAAHFESLFTTEASIDTLKQTLLQLAVMGKLVPQDPNDEPASELLKRIQAEKARMIAEGKIKKDKPMPPMTDEEKPFELPQGWEWVRLGRITSKITDGDHKTPPRTLEGFRLLSAKNVRDSYLDFDNCDFISEQDYLKSRERCCPDEGDLLIVSVGGTIGRTSLVPNDSNFALVRSVALIKPLLLSSFYFKQAMDSNLLQESIHARKRGGAQPCLYLSEIEQFIFPLPSLPEQLRIVAKIDELMTLCDQLKSTITQASRLKQKLANAVVEQAVAS